MIVINTMDFFLKTGLSLFSTRHIQIYIIPFFGGLFVINFLESKWSINLLTISFFIFILSGYFGLFLKHTHKINKKNKSEKSFELDRRKSLKRSKMVDTQHFCLRWNNYQSSITSAFENLRDDEDFVDVTLACDGRSLKAHRVVLSACSPYFRELLKVRERFSFFHFFLLDAISIRYYRNKP